MSSPTTGSEPAKLPYSPQYGGSIALVASTFVSGISWGFMTSMYGVCIHSLVRRLRSTQASRKTALLAVWVTLLWILSSISTMADAACTLYVYSWKLDFPGGPFVYLLTVQDHTAPVLAYITYLLTMWVADAMMLWRLVVCFKGVNSLTRGLVFGFMFLIYISSIGAGCYTMVVSNSNQPLFSSLSRRGALPCIVLSVTLNVLATAFIVIRLLLYKRRVDRNLGKIQVQGSPYMSIAAMLVESSALYATWSLVFIIVYAMCNPGQYVLLTTLCNVQVIAPLLIVYRVSKGTALEETMSAESTSTRTKPVYSDHVSQSGPEMIVIMRKSEQQVFWDSGSNTPSSDPSQAEPRTSV